MITRIGPVLLLAFTSAMTAEFLLGDQYLDPNTNLAMQLGSLVVFMAFYGTAAVLIRELIRRVGTGWPGLLCVALGFGIFEEGMVTQSLFNPDYVGQHLLRAGYLPALGIGAVWTIFVLSLHVIWSIGSPIALVEANAGAQPRLRAAGLIVCSVIFLIGAAATYAANLFLGPTRFTASPYQLATSLVLVVILVVIGVRLPRRTAAVADHTAGARGDHHPIPVAVAAGFAATTGFQLFRELPGIPAAVTCLLMVAVLAAGALLAVRLRLEPAGLAVGAILTYSWVGVVAASSGGAAAVTEQLLIVAAYLVVCTVTLVRTVRRCRLLRSGRSRSLDSGVSQGR